MRGSLAGGFAFQGFVCDEPQFVICLLSEISSSFVFCSIFSLFSWFVSLILFLIG